jgi:hypothetical protein
MPPVATSAEAGRKTPVMWRLSESLTAGTMLVVLVALGALLRVLYLDRQSLWFDEGVGLIFSGCDAVSGCLEAMLRTRTSERFQLLYPLLLHEWRVLFGSSEIALRSLSVLFNVAALALIGVTARRLFGTAHAAWSLAFMALSGFTLVHAQEARPYTLFLLIAAAQLWLFATAREGSRGARLGLYAVTALAAWAGLFPLLFSVALALADLIERGLCVENIRRWFIWWLPAGLVCLPAVLYYGYAATDMRPDDVLVPRSQQPFLNAAFLVYGQFVGQTFGPPVEALRGPARLNALVANAPLLVALVAVLLFGAAHGWRLWRGRAWGAISGARVLLLAALCYCALLLLFAVLTRHNLLPRHAVALHPLLALLLPCLVKPSPRARPYAGHAFMVALLALNLVSVGRHYFDRTQWKDDYRGAAAYLKEVGEPRRPVLVLRGLPVLFAYYGYDRMSVVMDPPRAQVPAVVADALGGRAELVIVVNRETDLWPKGWLETTLAPNLRLARAQELPYFSIYTFVRR